MFITTTSAAEYKVLEHQYLISRTDLNSRITYVNETFIEVSGYTEADLLGATNGLFRHPDMPDAVFDDIWATLKANRIWSGIMKHLRRDGSFFWVLATISPIIQDFALITRFAGTILIAQCHLGLLRGYRKGRTEQKSSGYRASGLVQLMYFDS